MADIKFTPFAIVPIKGGLSYKDYPNPYGLRAYPIKDKKGRVIGYGGEMLPKSEGWLGQMEGQGDLKGSTVTEYSLEDNKGSFPSVVPTLDEYERDMVSRGIITPEILKKATEWRDLMQSQGMSPFYNTFEF